MFLISSLLPTELGRPVFPFILRGNDSQGSGKFGASRDGGTRAHKGLDIRTYSGQNIYSPISGKVQAIFNYNGTLGVYIKSGNRVVKIIYLKTVFVSAGDNILRGFIVGKAADIRPKYRGITNHIHLEYIKNGFHENPENYLSIF